ncbi:hypothetical protein D9M71_456520 [compost metagenome]
MAWCRVGRQAEASTLATLSSAVRNRRSWPLLALVAAMNSCSGLARRRSKSICVLTMSRSGLMSNGLNCCGDSCWIQYSITLALGDRPPLSTSAPALISGALCATASQKRARAWRAPSRPPCNRPWASTTAFIAPALVPLMPSKSTRPSSSRASSTPQVKAPCAPPPCRARLRGRDLRARKNMA